MVEVCPEGLQAVLGTGLNFGDFHTPHIRMLSRAWNFFQRMQHMQIRPAQRVSPVLQGATHIQDALLKQACRGGCNNTRCPLKAFGFCVGSPSARYLAVLAVYFEKTVTT